MTAASARHMATISELGSTAVFDLLHRRVERLPFCGCHVWTGPTNGMGRYGRGGYGVVTILGRHLYVHRLAYAAANGVLPDSLLVCHRCDVRTCINPDHLFLGTPRDNHDDKVLKNRQRSPGASGDANGVRKHPEVVRGENNGRAVLTIGDVAEIRRCIASGEPQRSIAKAFSIGQSQVSRIKRGEAWKT